LKIRRIKKILEYRISSTGEFSLSGNEKKAQAGRRKGAYLTSLSQPELKSDVDVAAVHVISHFGEEPDRLGGNLRERSGFFLAFHQCRFFLCNRAPIR
jgi:hypothetical protein